MKKIINFIIFLLLIASSYLYMSNKYNENGIEIRLDSNVEYEFFKDNIMAGTLQNDSINYERNYYSHKLIMTTGMDMQFKNNKVKYGEFITSKDRDLIVIGDDVSNKYFMTDNSIGRDIIVMGKKYIVKGIVKDSNEIYIPYEKELLRDRWDNTIIRIEPIGKEGLHEYNRRKELVFSGISKMGVQVLDQVYYRDIINFYKNIGLIAIIANIALLIKKIYKGLHKSIKIMWLDYKSQSKEINALSYIVRNKKIVLEKMLKTIIVLLLGYVIYKFFNQIWFNKDYFPNNIFSLESYSLVIKNYCEKWVLRLSNGLTNVLLDFIKLNIIIIFVIFVLLIKDKEFKETGGEGIGRNTVKKTKESIS